MSLHASFSSFFNSTFRRLGGVKNFIIRNEIAKEIQSAKFENFEMEIFSGIQGDNIDFDHKHSRRLPIHYECEHGDLEKVKHLLENQSNLDICDDFGWQPIHYACYHRQLEIVEVLIASQCNIDASDLLNMRPIHLACQTNQVEIVRCLLRNNCDTEVSGEFDYLPIHIAAIYGYVEIFNCLIGHHCNIEGADQKGRRAIHFSSKYGNVEILRCLLQNQCNKEAATRSRKRAIHLACKYGKPEIVKMLISQRCNIEAPAKLEMRPIHYACLMGHLDIVKYLLRNKSKIDSCAQFKLKPIHFACMRCELDVVKYLLQKQCEIESCYNDLLKLAYQNKCRELVILIRAALKNRSMSNIAMAMGVMCDRRCSHSSCIISWSEDDLKNGSLIGCGSFGQVYKIYNPRNDVTFAIKFIFMVNEKKYFETEINKFGDRLQHERIVQYYGTKIDNGKIYIFMEYVGGGSLYERINEPGDLSHTAVAKYCRQILEGLAFLHHNKIIHRDVKPANMLLDLKDNIKLTDFGLSHSFDSIRSFRMSPSRVNWDDESYDEKEIVASTTICGTVNYLAPEVINEEGYSFPADIWSTGATVVEMITGYPPYYDLIPVAACYRIGKTRKIDFQPLQPLSDDFTFFIHNMLDPDPNKRGTANGLLEFTFVTTFR